MLETRQKMDRGLFEQGDDVDTEYYGMAMEEFSSSSDPLIEEFGPERVSLAYYYFHRHRLLKSGIPDIIEPDWDDLVAFLMIEEEQGLREAEQAANLEAKAHEAKTKTSRIE